MLFRVALYTCSLCLNKKWAVGIGSEGLTLQNKNDSETVKQQESEFNYGTVQEFIFLFSFILLSLHLKASTPAFSEFTKYSFK